MSILVWKVQKKLLKPTVRASILEIVRAFWRKLAHVEKNIFFIHSTAAHFLAPDAVSESGWSCITVFPASFGLKIPNNFALLDPKTSVIYCPEVAVLFCQSCVYVLFIFLEFQEWFF